MHRLEDLKIGIIGLGYVGLPLALAFAQHHPVVGYDIRPERIATLRLGQDTQGEVGVSEFTQASHWQPTDHADDLKTCNCYIITVPTPIDEHNRPDLQPLLDASALVGGFLKPMDMVIYESTVYPGATEEDCVPVLEKFSGLTFNHDFFCGYSPERINPGDHARPLTSILKITSGSTPEIAQLIDQLYQEIITAGTYLAPSMRVAEAAKIIENTQRDVNIAFINEIAMILQQLGIDTEAVLEAAATKWNFLPFRPGLVGGHCIGVDPYYLSHKALSQGHHPELILTARLINNNMAPFIATQMIKAMIRKKITISGARLLILGFSFKENCSDIRNTQIHRLANALEEFENQVDIYDPVVNAHEVKAHYGRALIDKPTPDTYDGIILAVGHDIFTSLSTTQIHQWGKETRVIYDLKHLLAPEASDLRL